MHVAVFFDIPEDDLCHCFIGRAFKLHKILIFEKVDQLFILAMLVDA